VRYNEIKEEYKKDGTYLIRAMTYEQTLDEESPDTIEGSFTKDLTNSKLWLCEKLKQCLKGKDAGNIYALGSWYGNIGIYLQEKGIDFDKLYLVEKDMKLLQESKKLLKNLFDEGKLVLMHMDAKDVRYERPCTIINCSTNEMSHEWMEKVPDGTLICVQSRNNIDEATIYTDDIGEFSDNFPMKKTLYLGKKTLKDPEDDYERFLKIGIMGKKLDENYMNYGMAEKRAKKENKKVVLNDYNLYEIVEEDDPRPAMIRNPDRLDLEPKLKQVYNNLRQKKLRFIDLKRKIDVGFISPRDYPEVNMDSWKKLRQDIRDVRRQLDSLPKHIVPKAK